MDNPEVMLLASALLGVVAPYVVALGRKLFGSFAESNLGAQALALVVSAVLAIVALVATGNFEWNGDLLASLTLIFTVANLVYKNFQEHFDRLK